MPTSKECRHNAEICITLATETSEIYAKTALIEMAKEFRAMAQHLERSSEKGGALNVSRRRTGGEPGPCLSSSPPALLLREQSWARTNSSFACRLDCGLAV